MALWGLSVADHPLAAEGKTAVMQFICVAGREMVNAGRETSMAKPDFSISGFETIANVVATENCRRGVRLMPWAIATGRDWRRAWQTAEDQTLTAKVQALTAEDRTLTAKVQALFAASVQPNAATTKSGTKILAICCPFS